VFHMRKERFRAAPRKSKLQPRGDEPFQVLEKINDNAYKLDLPREYDNISVTFNVVDPSFFDVGNELDSRTNPFEEGGNDGGATSPSNDPLHRKQALQSLILKIKEKVDQCEVRAAPN